MDVGQLRDGTVRGLLHPALQLVGAVQRVALVGVQQLHRLRDAGPGPDPVRGLLLQLPDPLHLGQAPAVGLRQVDPGAQEPAGEVLVALDPHPVGLLGLGQEVGAQPRRGLPVAATCHLHGPAQLVGQVRVQLAVGGSRALAQRVEEAAGRHPRVHLLGQLLHLATGRQDAALHARLLGDEPGDHRGGHRPQPAHDGVPVRRRGGGHLVVDGTDRVQGGGDVVHAQQVKALLVHLEVQPQPLAHRRDRHLVHHVDGRGLRQQLEGLAVQLVQRTPAGGGEVVVLVLAQPAAHLGQGDRAHRQRLLEVLVGDPVHLGAGALRNLVHAGPPYASPRPCRPRRGRAGPAAGISPDEGGAVIA